MIRLFVLIAAALISHCVYAEGIPKECTQFGRIVYVVALARDNGLSLKAALAKGDGYVPANIVMSVYKMPEMPPRDLQIFSVGLCTGATE